MDIYESQRKSVIMIWNRTFLRITKSNCNELWFTMTVCRHNNFFHITDSEILLLSVWMQKYINLFKDSILWLIIVLSFSLDRLESSVTNFHFFSLMVIEILCRGRTVCNSIYLLLWQWLDPKGQIMSSCKAWIIISNEPHQVWWSAPGNETWSGSLD